METKGSNAYLNMGMGCLLYIAIFAAIAYGIRPWTAPYEASEWGVWPGVVAAVFFTLAVGSLWELLKRLFTGRDPRAEILARADNDEVPDADGLMVASGRVRAAAGVLKAPLSGADCVAYFYRMYYETVDKDADERNTVAVYSGYASRPFIVDTRIRALRIMAPPQMDDPAARRMAPENIARAQQYVAATQFEEKSGLLGGVASAFSVVNALLTDADGEYRKDWKLAGESRGPASLVLEENVIAVGDTISLTGMWSVERAAVVSGVGVYLTVTHGDIKAAGAARLPPGNVATGIWLLVTTAIGAGIVWAATLLRSF